MRGLSSVLEFSITRTSISLGRLFLALGVAVGVALAEVGSRGGRLEAGGEPEIQLITQDCSKKIVIKDLT